MRRSPDLLAQARENVREDVHSVHERHLEELVLIQHHHVVCGALRDERVDLGREEVHCSCAANTTVSPGTRAVVKIERN